MIKFIASILLCISASANTQWGALSNQGKNYSPDVYIILDGDNSKFRLVQEIDPDVYIFINFTCKIIEKDNKTYLRLLKRSYIMPEGYKLKVERKFDPMDLEFKKNGFILELILNKGSSLKFIDISDGRIKDD